MPSLEHGRPSQADPSATLAKGWAGNLGERTAVRSSAAANLSRAVPWSIRRSQFWRATSVISARGRFYSAQALLDELYTSLADRSTTRLLKRM
jgi:hypothetical protein